MNDASDETYGKRHHTVASVGACCITAMYIAYIGAQAATGGPIVDGLIFSAAIGAIVAIILRGYYKVKIPVKTKKRK